MARNKSRSEVEQAAAGGRKWWQRRRASKRRQSPFLRGRFEVLEPRHLLAVIPISPVGVPTDLNNDFTVIDNAIQAANVNDILELTGTFDWTETNAAASWADSDYAIFVPEDLSDVTVTAPGGLGTARIQGPGDSILLDVDYEGFLYFDGENPGWEISNLEIFDFDQAILFGSAGSFDNTTITDNHIRVATDVPATVLQPWESYQNIGINYGRGVDQLISGNLIEFPGTGDSSDGSTISVGIMSITSGGSSYDGLEISDNVLRVTGDQAANPEVIGGIWENGHAHQSTINILGNSFENLGPGNDAALNAQTAFRITSHSSLTSTVTYSDNDVDGANMGFVWLGPPCCPGQDFSAWEPIELISNQLTDVQVGVLIQSQGSANLSGNTLTGNGTASSIGVRITEDSSASLIGTDGPNSISGFDTGVDVDNGTALIEDAILNGNEIGVLIQQDGTADLGDNSDTNITQLGTGSAANGSSTGGNDFSGYTATATPTSGAIVVSKIDTNPGSQGILVSDVPAQGNTWDDPSYAGIENVVHHDVDDSNLAFVLFAEQGVIGRHFFYNNSAWDGGNAAASPADDFAIAPDKTPLLPGDTATFANYTSYVGGINGIMIDFYQLPGTVTASDFSFHVGNNNTPSGWAAGPTPFSVTQRPTPGFLGSTRVTLIWQDYFSGGDPATTAAGKTWLEVRVLPTANTGLSDTDLFYVGNAIGDSGQGNQASLALVTGIDRSGPRLNPVSNPPGASIQNPYDYDRDRNVDTTDETIVQFNSTTIFTALHLITIAAPLAAPLPTTYVAPQKTAPMVFLTTKTLAPVPATSVSTTADSSVWTTADASQETQVDDGRSQDSDEDAYATSVDIALESLLTDGLIGGRLLSRF